MVAHIIMSTWAEPGGAVTPLGIRRARVGGKVSATEDLLIHG